MDERILKALEDEILLEVSGKYFIIDTGRALKLYSELEDEPLGMIVYSGKRDFIFLNGIASKESGQGYFGKLFEKMICLAEKKKVESLKLMVDLENGNARNIYEHYGFVEEPSSNPFFIDRNRIPMRRKL